MEHQLQLPTDSGGASAARGTFVMLHSFKSGSFWLKNPTMMSGTGTESVLFVQAHVVHQPSGPLHEFEVEKIRETMTDL